MSAVYESSLSRDLDVDELMQLTHEMAKGVRLSGSDDERHAFDFAEAYLRKAGLRTQRLTTEVLAGYPLEAALEVLDPAGLRLEAWGNNLAPSTAPEGVEGELVLASAGGDVTGRIVLVDSGNQVSGQPLAFVRPDVDPDRIHERGVSPLWGNPTPVTLALVPRTPSVGVSGRAGKRLAEMVNAGPVRVRVSARMYREWTAIPLLVADVAGSEEDDFVLFSAHIDSWYFGAMDNGAANAVQLQMARLLQQNRSQLRRGVRIAFWSGHSHAKFAGSAWYADTHWQELYDRCVCHVYIDSPGAVGATVVGECQTMAETYRFTADAIRRATGEELRYFRIARAGDQSFWGIGVPSTLVLPSLVPVDSGQAVPQVGATDANTGGLPWFWHTPEDTVDKIDAHNLIRDARMYAETLGTLTAVEKLPFDYEGAADEMVDALHQYQATLPASSGVSEVVDAAASFKDAIARWNRAPHEPDVHNRVVKMLGRELIPVTYTQQGPFDHDPGSANGPFPGIAAGIRAANLREGTDERRALELQTRRQVNRARFALTKGVRLLEG